MAEKDISEKILMQYTDVFADCENVLAYGGRRRLRAELLQPAPTESFYKGKERMHNQLCDISFYLVEDGKIRAQYIIGNETRLRRRQVLRKASYEGGAYRGQLESRKPMYPVISMVIDWTRKQTSIPLSIHGLLKADGVAKEDMLLAEDIRLTVHHMRRLPREIRDKFTSDIGFVADYLNEGSFENRKEQKIVHVKALCDMMYALTGDTRFTELIEELLEKQEKGGEVIMCEYIDMLEARGEARGIIKGEAQGIAKGEAQGIVKGEAQGIIKGESRLASLLEKLYSLGREEDARLAVRDEKARKEMYEEFGTMRVNGCTE